MQVPSGATPPEPHPGKLTFDEAVRWAESARHWRASKAHRLAHSSPNSDLWREFPPGRCEALARRAERRVREAAARAEMALVREQSL